MGPGWKESPPCSPGSGGARVRSGRVDHRASKKQTWESAGGCAHIWKTKPRMNYARIILHLHRNFCLFTVEEHKEENLFHTWHLI